jgi:hypothetical protein
MHMLLTMYSDLRAGNKLMLPSKETVDFNWKAR